MWLTGVLVAVVLAGVGWAALGRTVRRRAASSAEAARRSQLFSAFTMLVSASLLLVVSVFVRDNSRYYFLIPLAAFMALTALVVLRRNRKAPTS
jgi:FtsH-binding integral membrane protein